MDEVREGYKQKRPKGKKIQESLMEADTPKSGQKIFGSESKNGGNTSATLNTPVKANK